MGRRCGPPRPYRYGIWRVDADRALHFGRIVAHAFGMSEAAAYDGDTPAGAGACVGDGVGWLEWGATHRDHRRRGSQGAIMAVRSYANIERGGFRPSTLRLNLAPPKG